MNTKELVKRLKRGEKWMLAENADVGLSGSNALLSGTFELSDKDVALHQLAQQYHEECEEYDKTICSGKRDGVAMPINGQEMAMINKHARSVRERVIAAAGMRDASKREMVQAIQRWHHDR